MSEIVFWCHSGASGSSDSVPRLDVLIVVLFAVLDCSVPRRAVVAGAPVSPEAIALDAETVVGDRHYLRGYPAENSDGSVNAVIAVASHRNLRPSARRIRPMSVRRAGRQPGDQGRARGKPTNFDRPRITLRTVKHSRVRDSSH
ncbi:MAG: hypothetical protein AB7P03_08445 [Kofleriaceae bacterium]